MPALFCAALALAGCAALPRPGHSTYYVKADGDDKNDGFSEERAFKSLFKALTEAGAAETKTITVLGTLDIASERSSNNERVFIIQGTGKEQITIKGGDEENRALLSGANSGRRVIIVKGLSNIRFENIDISGGFTQSEGGGIALTGGAELTLGEGARVFGNRSGAAGGGIAALSGGRLYIRGGEISGNSTAGIGGGAAIGRDSLCVMEGGLIRDNSAEGGGGAAIYEGGLFQLRFGRIAENRAEIIGGGAALNGYAEFSMEGGLIEKNYCSASGGGMGLTGQSSFAMTGGEIRENACDQYGGGLAADDKSQISLSGGFFRANSAGEKGGGVFTSGAFIKLSAHDSVIYGKEAPARDANKAPDGAAVCVFRGGAGGLFRETSAGRGTVLDSGQIGAGGGWENRVQ